MEMQKENDLLMACD